MTDTKKVGPAGNGTDQGNVEDVTSDYTAHDPLDTPKWLLAAIMAGDANRCLALYRHLAPADLDAPDAAIYQAAMDVAGNGHAPTPPLVHGRLAANNAFAGRQGDRIKSRMLECATTPASPMQAPELARTILDCALRRAALAAGEGIAHAAGNLPVDLILDYMVEQGRRVRALDERRRAIGGAA